MKLAPAKRRAPVALWLMAALLGTGCQSSSPTPAAPVPFRLDKSKSVEITPGDEAFSERRTTAGPPVPKRHERKNDPPPEMTEGEIHALPKFTVTQKGFLKFGLSVVTNVEVTRGGGIEWMRVGVVLPDSPAARQGLFTGMEILAIDGIPVAYLDRERMLHLLFEREAGDHVRLLVYSRAFGPLPLFITLPEPPPRVRR